MTIADLTGRVGRVLPDPVDELQVAAVLESLGVTDRTAVEVYRAADVFDLARQVYERLPHVGEGGRHAADHRSPAPRSWYDVVHGPLYLLPAVGYPAVFTALGGPAAIRALVLATTVGWLWGAGTVWIAHRVLRSGAGGVTGRLLRVLATAGAALAAVGALALPSPSGGPVAVLFVMALTGYQIASGILVFYHREPLVLLTSLPVVLGGAGYLVSGLADALVSPVLLFGCASAAATFGLALLVTLRAEDAPGARPPGARALVLGALPVIGHTALCAAFLFYTDVRFIGGAVDLAVAAAPLALGMGVAEWRANRFFEQAAELLRERRPTAWFRSAVWRMLLRELANCLVVLGGLALVLLACLRVTGLLTSRGALLVDAHVVLGGAFFLGFVLIRTGRLPRLLAVLAGVLIADVALAEFVVADAWAPHAHVPVFLLCGTALALLMLSTLRTSVGEVHHYR
ncbi:hypothetical protein [Saccharothrix yanglingensis]|uniref:DUF2157 domain-containing protein n=1 Tax=Saccharothrix yanglingensis TaxID=659496 RepID=A0ABU0XAG5_9PSEU|nr:hypothetical protein [Saccharothrix yanglingensis]MDQ2589100.1 hypothetical protein [Saccharothrix yanglingensis]